MFVTNWPIIYDKLWTKYLNKLTSSVDLFVDCKFSIKTNELYLIN